MIFKEFGYKTMPVIIFLHGGGLSWWSWKPQIETLQKDYHIVTPIIDAQITVEILSEECDITENSVIESALVYPIKLAIALTVPMYNRACQYSCRNFYF